MADLQYIMALDYGAARIGVAVASSIARLPRPLTTIVNGPDMYQQITQLEQREVVGLVVVGLPRTMDGGYSQQTHDAEAFAKQLGTVLPVPIEMADETLTSVDAEAELGDRRTDKAAVDALAACLILERYLQGHSATEVQL
jgi:putative Holliday junction resolvase